MDFLWVFIGGGIGSICRYGISKLIGVSGSGFPTATLVANIASCIVLGLALKFLPTTENFPSAYKLLILVGFCGGFSTFSTFSVETLHLIQLGQTGLAILYVGISLIVCLSILFLMSKM